MSSKLWAIGISALLLSSVTGSVFATETKTYTYDALGRLVQVDNSGDVNDDETRSFCYDQAGNRINFTATSDGSAAGCVDDGTGPSVIQITDSSFNVLSQHSSDYDCQKGSYMGSPYEFCRLLPSLVVVYSIWANPQFDTGYSMDTPYTFEVESAYLGTADP